MMAFVKASLTFDFGNDFAHKLHTNCTQAANKTANNYYFNLLYFTLLGTLSFVCTISFAATNSANRRVTAYLSFSCSLRRALASLLLIVSIILCDLQNLFGARNRIEPKATANAVNLAFG